MKKLTTMLCCLLAVVILNSNTGCELSATADQVDVQRQAKIQQEGNAQVGMPDIHNFAMKKMAKMVQEECDKPDLIMYAYTYSEMTGKMIFIGKCIGYGLPYSTEYTSPQRPAQATETHEAGNLALPQADPNGLFMPASSDGTWLMLIDPATNKPRVVYIEPKIIVSPFKLQ